MGTQVYHEPNLTVYREPNLTVKNYPDEERAKSEVEQQIVEGKDPRLPKKVDPLRRPPSPGSDETQKSPTEPAPPPPQ